MRGRKRILERRDTKSKDMEVINHMKCGNKNKFSDVEVQPGFGEASMLLQGTSRYLGETWESLKRGNLQTPKMGECSAQKEGWSGAY